MSLLFRDRSIHRGAVAVLVGILAAGCSAGQAVSPSSLAGDVGVQDANVQAALVTSCYECHSNQHAIAWNARLAPSYWFAGSARKTLNFSDWGKYDTQRRSAELTAIAKTVSAGEMPPGDYKAMRPSAALSVENKAAVVQWASQAAVPAH